MYSKGPTINALRRSTRTHGRLTRNKDMTWDWHMRAHVRTCIQICIRLATCFMLTL